MERDKVLLSVTDRLNLLLRIGSDVGFAPRSSVAATFVPIKNCDFFGASSFLCKSPLGTGEEDGVQRLGFELSGIAPGSVDVSDEDEIGDEGGSEDGCRFRSTSPFFFSPKRIVSVTNNYG